MSARRRLSRLLLLSHVGLVVLLATLILATGARTIGAAAQQQAEARATQAAAEALRRLEATKRELAVVAGLLSERPTLQRYLRREQSDAAAEFLEPFRITAGVDYVRVSLAGNVFAEVGQPPPDVATTGLQFADDRTPWLVELQPIDAGTPGAGLIVVATQVKPAQLAGAGNDETQLALHAPASLVASTAFESRDAGLRDAFEQGEAGSLRGSNGYAAVRVEPLRSDGGVVVGLLTASLPQEVVSRQTWGWVLAFALGSAVVALLAGAVAVWLTRRISRPFAALAQSASRLGAGDLETPVPQPESDLDEPSRLAESLENMRRRVNQLHAAERDQRQELDGVLEGVDEGIFAVDLDRRVRYVNRQFLRLVGNREDRVLGAFCGDVLQPARLEDGSLPCVARCPLVTARASGLEQRSERCLAGGRVRSLVLRVAAPVGGRQVSIVREESPAEAARTLRDAILANLSHEFQTPLAAQVASVELLRDHLADSGDAVAQRLVDAQYRGALRLTHLVENLLASVRMEAGEFRLRHHPVDLKLVVHEAADLMRPLLAQRRQQLQLLLQQMPRKLSGDAQRLQQVVVNLLANANKFAPDSSTIWIELESSDERASLWVEDEGDGLPVDPASAHDLFAPFQRAPEAEPSQRGSGLGLAIVRSLVQRHGGEVEFAEPRHRRGARIGVHLPLELTCES